MNALTEQALEASLLQTLHGLKYAVREDGTPLNDTPANLQDWCKSTFEVGRQLRINADTKVG